MRDRRISWLIVLLFVGSALLVQCRGGSTLAPASVTATPAGADGAETSPLPAPTSSPLFASPISPLPAPSATPVAKTDAYAIQAWTLFSKTAPTSIQEASARFTRDGEGVAGAEMYAVAHFRGNDYRYPEQGYQVTDERGIASVSFSAADAGAEETVQVDVYVVYSETTYHSVVYFTANC
jgi:hypothetical protein